MNFHKWHTQPFSKHFRNILTPPNLPSEVSSNALPELVSSTFFEFLTCYEFETCTRVVDCWLLDVVAVPANNSCSVNYILITWPRCYCHLIQFIKAYICPKYELHTVYRKWEKWEVSGGRDGSALPSPNFFYGKRAVHTVVVIWQETVAITCFI